MRGRTWEANLITGFVLSLVLAALVLAVWYGWERWPIPVVLMLIIAALGALACIAGLLFGAFDMLMAQHALEWARVEARQLEATPAVALVRAQTDLVTRLNSSNPVVLDILSHDPALARVIAGNFGPVVAVTTKDGDVPYSFIDEWYAVNVNREILYPVRDWDTAGHRKLYASWLERHLSDLHILIKWAGQGTARWASDAAKADFVKQFYGQRINAVQREGEG